MADEKESAIQIQIEKESAIQIKPRHAVRLESQAMELPLVKRQREPLAYVRRLLQLQAGATPTVQLSVHKKKKQTQSLPKHRLGRV